MRTPAHRGQAYGRPYRRRRRPWPVQQPLRGLAGGRRPCKCRDQVVEANSLAPPCTSRVMRERRTVLKRTRADSCLTDRKCDSARGCGVAPGVGGVGGRESFGEPCRHSKLSVPTGGQTPSAHFAESSRHSGFSWTVHGLNGRIYLLAPAAARRKLRIFRSDSGLPVQIPLALRCGLGPAHDVGPQGGRGASRAARSPRGEGDPGRSGSTSWVITGAEAGGDRAVWEVGQALSLPVCQARLPELERRACPGIVVCFRRRRATVLARCLGRTGAPIPAVLDLGPTVRYQIVSGAVYRKFGRPADDR